LTLENLEKNRILKALAENNWRRENAAQSLGMNRKTLYRKMQKLGLASSVSSQLSQNGT
jgi:transcriptional regulator of acetoin/glycerol metabolism